MEKKLEFTIQPLLKRKDGKVSGPMSPLLAAQEFCKQSGDRFNRLARLCAKDPEVNNWYESPGKRDLTGCDTLILGGATKDNEVLHVIIMIDAGTHAIPVCIWFPGDEDITVTPVYRRQPLARHLTDEELIIICKQAAESGALNIIEK